MPGPQVRAATSLGYRYCVTRRARHRRRGRQHGHALGRFVLVALLTTITGAVIAAAVAASWVVDTADSSPNLNQLPPRDPHPLTRFYAANGSLLGYVHAQTVFTRVAPQKIPAILKKATVAIEDRRFWQHGAIDYQGIVRAGIRDLFGGASVQGASTLTMQLVDNMYMPPRYRANHNLQYKVVQAKLAIQLERRHSKSWVLDTYLNDVPYGTVGGETAQGVGAAARMFFARPVWKLSLPQLAMLAGLPQSPTDYNPFVDPQRALARRQEVLQAMVRSHYISQAQASAAEKAPLGVRSNHVYTSRRLPQVFDYALSQLIQHYGANIVDNGGLKVYTTIDPRMIRIAHRAIMAHQPGGPVLDRQPAAGLAAVNPANGHILAVGSSASYAQSRYDFATQARRQPGSAFKVFALMTLIHDYHGSPSKTYYTSKHLRAGWLRQEPTWSVQTAERTYQGRISVRRALILSDNTVFAQLVVDLGPRRMDAMAHAMGIDSPLRALPAEVLGGLSVGVTPLEMADAYATLADGGIHHEPTMIDRVVFPDGHVDASLGSPAGHRVFSYAQAHAAIRVMEGVIRNPAGTGTAANYGCPAAGKTGTAQNLANAWFVGFNPRMSTAVWVGYPQGNVPMPNGFGGVLAAPIWHDFMARANRGYCGGWRQPAHPFHGRAFRGPHSS